MLEGIRGRLDAHGWTIVQVMAGTGTPAFGYTVGFPARFGAPECLVVGIDPRTVVTVLSGLADALENGRVPASCPEGRHAGVVRDLDVGIRALPPGVSERVTRMAARFAWEPFEVRQVLVPDPAGTLPGEAGCAAPYERHQDPAPILREAGLAAPIQ